MIFGGIMSYRSILLSLATGLCLLSTPVTQAMSWDFWTRDNYQNTWLVGTGSAVVGLLYYAWQTVNKPETAEECYNRVQTISNNLHKHYDAKIADFERGYTITAGDITSMSGQFESARQQWTTRIDEDALAQLGFDNRPATLRDDVKRLSAAKIELSKMRRQLVQERKNVSLAKQMEILLSDISFLFLRLDFLKQCVEHNKSYLAFSGAERTMSQEYAHVVNVSGSHANLKQIICAHSAEKSHQYIKFIQILSNDTVSFGQKITQIDDAIRSTKLFHRAQQLQNKLMGIEKRIYADKTLHNDLRAYQKELLKQMEKKVRKIYVAIGDTQVEADKVRALEGRLSVVIATYTAYQVWANHNGEHHDNNAISAWQMDKVHAISRDIEKIFSEIQKARGIARSLGKEIARIQARFDEADISVPEQFSLQSKVDKKIKDAENTIQAMQDAEKSVRKSADDLRSWARNNNLFLV